MRQLNSFINLLTGSFQNSEQYEKMKKNGIEFPFAEHENTVCNDKIRNLTSYETPGELKKDTFTYENLTGIDFRDLKPAESMFSPVLKFTLFERFSEEYLEVSEIMKVNGKRTFRYDSPIVYKSVERI